MRKQNINKLQYPLWYNIVFAILTVGVPLGLFVYECLTATQTSGGTVLKVTFIAITIAIIAWLFINNLVIKKFKTKIVSKQALLEHDYSAGVGNADALKTMWYINERWLTFFDAINVVLYGGLGALILIAVQSSIIKIKGILVLIAACYIIAYTMKFILLIARKEITDETDSRATKSETSKVDDK